MKVVRLEDCINEIKSLDNCGVITRSTNHICEDMRKEVKEFEAVPIPDNATNGDVVKLIFPEYEETRMCGDVRYGSKEYVNLEFVVGEEWWDAAYQQGYSDDIRELMKKSKTDALDKVREDIVDTLYVDSLIFGELIDFKNGKISADDVIEEFNRVTRLEVLKILDKYRAEKEVEE